jgi:RimJ/RimL family protein N-acetyltransferase
MTIELSAKELSLANGSRVVIRRMTAADGAALQRFYRELPEEDRQFLNDDVAQGDWIERFIRRVDNETFVSLVAEFDAAIVGNATLARTPHGWTRHVAEIRVVVARDFQRKGLGTALAKAVVKLAVGMGLEKMVAHIVDNQVGAKRAFEKLGFKQEAVLKDHVKDIRGFKRDLLVMSDDVSHLWEAMEALVADYSPTIGG